MIKIGMPREYKILMIIGVRFRQGSLGDCESVVIKQRVKSK